MIYRNVRAVRSTVFAGGAMTGTDSGPEVPEMPA